VGTQALQINDTCADIYIYPLFYLPHNKNIPITIKIQHTPNTLPTTALSKRNPFPFYVHHMTYVTYSTKQEKADRTDRITERDPPPPSPQ
jgi:hypothetical protein